MMSQRKWTKRQNRSAPRRAQTDSGQAEQPRVDASGPQPAAGEFEFDVFLSYRRQDGSGLATWLRNRLQRYKPPKDVLTALPEVARQRLSQAPKVFLDQSNASTSDDFWKQNIVPNLKRSRRLLVISTPAALQRRDDGSENWVAREIGAYWEYFKDRSRILVALGPKAPEDRLPGRLDQLSKTWGWADLRGWRRFYWLFPGARRIEAAFVDLLADIFKIPTEFVPALRQEERRRRSRILSFATASAVVVLAILSRPPLATPQMVCSRGSNLAWAGMAASVGRAVQTCLGGTSWTAYEQWVAASERDIAARATSIWISCL
jgi:hypothetical protein